MKSIRFLFLIELHKRHNFAHIMDPLIWIYIYLFETFVKILVGTSGHFFHNITFKIIFEACKIKIFIPHISLQIRYRKYMVSN